MMKNKDLLRRFIFDTLPVRGEYIHLEQAYQTIIEQHTYPPPIRRILGEALCVAGLLTASIKFEGRLTVQFRGKGDLKLLLVQCDTDFNLRGLVKWEGELSYEQLMEAFKEGVLVIILDMNGKQNAYQGIVNWQGHSLAESIEGYFRDSEQLATKIWLQVSDKRAAGLLLQVIPSAEEDKSNLEQAAKDPEWKRIIELTGDLNPQELLTLPYDELLQKLYPDEQIRVFDPDQIQFKCTCSHKRSEDAVYLLGREEAEAELKANKFIVVTCDFCNQEYTYDKVDVAKIFTERDARQTKPIH